MKKFIWAQWDPLQQTLYYIHNRKRNRCLVEGEEEPIEDSINKLTPTLSGLQFNDEVPHETVVSKYSSSFIFCIDSLFHSDDKFNSSFKIKLVYKETD